MRRLVTCTWVGLALAGCAAPQIVHSRSGATTTLEELRGHALVVTFWDPDCAPCLKQMPLLIESVAPYEDRVLFLPIYVRERPGHSLDGWLAAQPRWFQDQICWANEPFLHNYDRSVMPRTYVYGRNGHVIEQLDGLIDAQRAPILKASLLRALAAQDWSP